MMRALKRMALMLVLVVVGIWLAVQFMSQKPPAGLGIANGGLADCPDSPNCVCSDCEGPRQMPPLKFTGELAAARDSLKSALKKKGIPVVEESENYLHAVATTTLMRFHDDLEFQIVPEEKRIHFRSASRFGKSDLGKNKARLNEIFEELAKSGIQPDDSALRKSE
jgi:uncharacterized protein (DUF1499 family)